MGCGAGDSLPAQPCPAAPFLALLLTGAVLVRRSRETDTLGSQEQRRLPDLRRHLWPMITMRWSLLNATASD